MVDAAKPFPSLLPGYMMLLTLVLLPFLNEDHSVPDDALHTEDRFVGT